ncbi:hypothetical protein SASPL_134156 [Salvia splendens]|uniref:Uncharacterized protein n=1 Tax=Salvia splendens TaxID=180675 RepID=A0A8X8X558_SALSN|nr:uncharacterized protein LOC121756900 [Salvia splendens]KAG6406552.1 hypothetical protein SASPL_134156 [Salvia splendens]
MEMEVMMPSPAPDFNFDSASTTPFMSAPSSPTRIPSSSFFYSAPTSPTAAIPFLWESTPGTPKSTYDQDLDDADFAFDFSGHLSSAPSLPADELFHAGKIKPLKPPPRHLYSPSKSSPKSPRSPRKNIFSPRHKSRDEIDPFAAAIEHTTKDAADRRGRDRSSRNKGSSRSLSPFRVSDLLFEPENETTHHNQSKSNSSSSSSSSVFSSSFWYKKWKIKDLLLFRSASESRAKDKDNMKQYSQLKKPTMMNRNDDVKNSSFRSTESVGSVSSRRRTGPPISAHELHYTVNRAFSEEMRRRTTLPYKQGLLGCLGFNPVPPEISKGAASMPRV